MRRDVLDACTCRPRYRADAFRDRGRVTVGLGEDDIRPGVVRDGEEIVEVRDHERVSRRGRELLDDADDVERRDSKPAGRVIEDPQLEQVARENQTQVASLGSLASEVSSLYGLKTDPILANASGPLSSEQVLTSIDQLYALRTSAFSGVATIALSSPRPSKAQTTADWLRMAELPNLWPVEGPVTGSFGEREDPFNGEGAFHSGVDISSNYGHPVIAPADGVVTEAETMGGYGRLIQIQHGNGISTRYGHLSGFAVRPGDRVRRGQLIGFVGLTGRSTGPHLHYEVRVYNTPVNPQKYLRLSVAQATFTYSGT